VNEDRLENLLLVRDQKMMHDAVAKIGGENFTRLRAVGDETDRTPWPVGVRAQLLLQREQVGLRVHFKGQGIYCVALVAAALAIVPPQRSEGIDVRADHRPPRTARAKLLLFLLSLFTLPSLKLTFHALFELLALVVDDQ
jgi:hypothetical protein